MNDMSPTTALIPLPSEPTGIAALFSAPSKVDTLIAEIEKKVADFVPDLSTKKGRESIRKLAADVARSKTALDNAGKDLNAGKRAEIDAVDAERRKIRDKLDALRDQVRKPLTDWEEAEEKRKAAMQAKVAEFTADGFSALSASAEIRARIDALESVTVDEDWQEFQDEAEFSKDTALAALRQHLAASEQREQNERELEQLRREKAEREAKEAAERAEREARERAEREKAEAEKRAREEEERRKAEAERRAKERADSIEHHIREVGEGRIGGQYHPYAILFYELEEKIPLEIGELEIGPVTARLQTLCDETRAALKAMQEREAADEIEKEAARKKEEQARKAEAEERAREEAAEAERQRIAAEREAERKEQERRASLKRVRAARLSDIQTALEHLPDTQPATVANAIMTGMIPHVTVTY